MAMEIPCNRCGAPVPIQRGEGFTECPSCATALYVDIRQTVLHKIGRPGIHKGQIERLIGTWLQQMECTADFEIASCRTVFLPFWQVARSGREASLVPGAPFALSLDDVQVPTGDFEFYTPEAADGYEVVHPTLTVDALKARLPFVPDEKDSIDLLHVPFHEIDLEYRGLSLPILVDAIHGTIHADHTPPSDQFHLDRKHALIFAGTFALFVIEGIFIPSFQLTVLGYAATGVGLYFGLQSLLEGGD